MSSAAPLLTPEGPGRDAARMPGSVVRILEGALRAIGRRGARRLSMSDISDASGVSRGTLYRYFSTKDEVLAAVSEFISVNFETGILEAAEKFDDPLERFRAAMRFFAQYTIDNSPERIFEIEPGFHLDFFRSHFHRHKAAVLAALQRSLDHFDRLCGRELDRDALAEALVRMQLSTLIVPADWRWADLWEAAPDTLERWIIELSGRLPAYQEE
jgi:AcrR family transcriptional regulator